MKRSNLLRHLAGIMAALTLLSALLLPAAAADSNSAAAEETETASLENASDVSYKPAQVTLKSAVFSGTGRIKLKWSRASTATGYQIQYSTSSGFSSKGKTLTITTTSRNTVTKTITKLAQSTYYVRVRAYRVYKGRTYYGKYSAKKKVKVTTGLGLKDLINSIQSDTSRTAKNKILELTDGDVNITKYSTTYDRMYAIYDWHCEHAQDFGSCLSCNCNFNTCCWYLFGQTERQLWIGDGYFVNQDGSKAYHQWSFIYFQGKEYQFDPRAASYSGAVKDNYFGFTAGTYAAAEHEVEDIYLYWA